MRVLTGKTIKERTPWGSLYVTLNFDSNEPSEVFVRIGKSGSEITAMTEAISRLISIGLRSGCRLVDFITTLKGLSGKESWMFDCDDEHVIRSLPEAIALLLERLNAPSSAATIAETHDATGIQQISNPSQTSGVTCPECGAPMELMSGCAYCLSCGYSPCK